MKWLLFLLSFSLPLMADISLQQMMSKRQMQETGVDQLNYSQMRSLEMWLDANFDLKDDRPKKEDDQLYLSLNVGEGRKLELSDGSSYEIAPEDQVYAAFWITPFAVSVGKSGDPNYPVKITNLNSGTSVRAKEISTEELIHEKQGDPKGKPEKKKKEKQKK